MVTFVHKVVKIHDCDICNKFSYGHTDEKKMVWRPLEVFFSGTTTVNNDLPPLQNARPLHRGQSWFQKVATFTMHTCFYHSPFVSLKKRKYSRLVLFWQIRLYVEFWPLLEPIIVHSVCITSMKNLMTMLSSF